MDASKYNRIVHEDGSIQVDGDGVKLLVMNDGQAKAFSRVGLRVGVRGPESAVRWLVGELNGVRVYVSPEAVILTTQDLYP